MVAATNSIVYPRPHKRDHGLLVIKKEGMPLSPGLLAVSHAAAGPWQNVATPRPEGPPSPFRSGVAKITFLRMNPIVNTADPILHAVADEAAARFDIDLPALLQRHDMKWSGPMPADWRHGAPLGNGEFGVVMHGSPRDLCFTLSRPDVWDRRNDAKSWFPGETFDEVRAAWRSNDREALARLWQQTAASKPIDMPHLTTCGTLRLHLDEGLNPAELKMGVELHTATAAMTWHDRSVRAYVSRRFGVLVIDIDRGQGNASPDPLKDCYDRRLPATELPWDLSRCPLDDNPRPQIETGDEISLLTQRFTAGGEYTIGIALVGFGQRERASVTGRLIGREASPAGQRCQVYLTVVSSAPGDHAADECRARLRAAVGAGAEAIALEHRAWWEAYWRRGLAAVGDPAVEKWYYRSLYLCGSMLEPTRQLPGLQGVWCGENNPPWYGDYHGNINVQCNVWGLLASNRLDLFEPYLRLYHEFAPKARRDAAEYFHLRGLKFPHAGSIGGHELTSPAHSRLSTEPCESAWVAQLFWQYYRYSGDREFLARIAYPILRDAALFIADFLTWDAERSRWTMGPMVHFESRAGEWEGWDHNTLYGQAFVRMGLTQATAAAAELDVDEDLRELWSEKLARLVEVPVGADGAWRPWENQGETYAGHNFMLPLVFPAKLVSAEHGPDPWRRAAAATWSKLVASGRPGHSGGAWCGGQGICEVLRLGDARTAFAAARWPQGACENGFTIVDWPTMSIMQGDHGAGMCRVLPDLMLLELGGVVHLFYGIPAGVPARFHSLRAPGGFLLSAERRGPCVDYVLVNATRAGRLRLRNPWPHALAVDHRSGEMLADSAAVVIELDLAAGQAVVVHAAGMDPALLQRQAFHVV